jgi:protein-tyrosine phosphatase
MFRSFLKLSTAVTLLFMLCEHAGADAPKTTSSGTKQILFVCTGNYYRSRFAEAFFNQKARLAHVQWKAISRGLALVPTQRGISTIALRELKERGVSEDLCSGVPKPLTQEDLDESDYIVLMDEAEHRVMFEKQFPKFDESRVHFWHILDGRVNAEQSCHAMSSNVDELLQTLPK